VTTSVGAEGIERGLCGPMLNVADGWLPFVSAVEEASTLDHTGPSPLFADAYDWRRIVERIPLN
jgi:hypothetical protein